MDCGTETPPSSRAPALAAHFKSSLRLSAPLTATPGLLSDYILPDIDQTWKGNP